jgi:hypothetical protein
MSTHFGVECREEGKGVEPQWLQSHSTGNTLLNDRLPCVDPIPLISALVKQRNFPAVRPSLNKISQIKETLNWSGAVHSKPFDDGFRQNGH